MKMKFFAGCATGLIMFGVAGMAGATPLQWSSSGGGNDHFYEAISGNYDWHVAKEFAASSTYNGLNGHLATLTTQAENNWVWNSFQNPYFYLLGGTDEGHEGIWQWITGEQWSYTNWSPSNPDNWLGEENYLEFYHNNTWNDSIGAAIPGVTVMRARGYIVEYESAPVPEPATMLLFGTGIAGLAGTVLRRKKQ